jgi:hypothetical protein
MPARQPARLIVTLVLIALFAGGATVLAAYALGLPIAALGLAFALAALALRLWIQRR